MELFNYLRGVLSHFKDFRIRENVKKLVQNIIEHKSIRLWSISENRAEFERSKRLLDGSLKSVLDEKKISDAIREYTVADLADEARLIVLHDPCDIRKPESRKLENLGKVRDLDGNLINGYSSFNSVAVDVNGKKLYPIDITLYSNRDKRYVTVEELDDFENGKLYQADPQRVEQIKQFIQEDSHVNLPILCCEQLKRISEAFKKQNPNMILCHVLDRQFDGVDYFEFIDSHLNDEFVIRLKLSRNSNEVLFDENKGKKASVKLKDVKFVHKQIQEFEKLTIKQKVYQNAKCLIEWGTLCLNGHDYTVERIKMTDREQKPIYKNPMLLISNMEVKTGEQARGVYGAYLMRAKIEAVFKFVKDVLGWEEFQSRDYESIKNILALAYFVGGYFYKIGSELAKNPTIGLIAQLGGGKGRFTRYYFLQGLKKLLSYASVVHFVEKYEISDELFEQMLAFVT
jgi:hypothetical protein